jgi:hypothetical protein
LGSGKSGEVKIEKPKMPGVRVVETRKSVVGTHLGRMQRSKLDAQHSKPQTQISKSPKPETRNTKIKTKSKKAKKQK